MKRLLLMRHAKSSWKDLSLTDHERPLNKRGKADGPRMADFIRDQDLVPEMILSSTARRAKSTAKFIAEFSGFEGEIVYDELLYHADISHFLLSVIEHSEPFESVMVVGHNPGLEMFLDNLVGDYYRMPTSAIAVVDIDINNWKKLADDDLEARLINVFRPKELFY